MLVSLVYIKLKGYLILLTNLTLIGKNIMSKTNIKKVATTSVTTNVNTSVSVNAKLTYVSKNGATHNINRAQAVGGFTYANALAHYKTLGYGKADLNYDIKGGRLILG